MLGHSSGTNNFENKTVYLTLFNFNNLNIEKLTIFESVLFLSNVLKNFNFQATKGLLPLLPFLATLFTSFLRSPSLTVCSSADRLLALFDKEKMNDNY
ncbi:hypothetical protein BpHYR1_049245 [Brachionus plicatilis]|uniref:Uncharacterized protein n=1 Tax=Brachionus plicatilis TaxID=10195 RepID=A0A3M7QNA4_BRAPC|nr:hypothetical protein BpHYR1_049245 [Brachionus plicatilis]